jgi:membrane protease YdiL (CAAX protease family)
MPSTLTRPQIVFVPAEPQLGLVSKILALIEVALVIIASVAAAMAGQRLITPGLGETLGLVTQTAPDYLASSVAFGKQFALQYGAAAALVVIFAALRKRVAPRAYALAFRPLGLARLVVLGVVAGLIVSIPTQSIFLAKEIWPLGKDTVLWTVMESNPWDWKFWVFAATGSFIIVPIIEEFLWRSYVLGRLVEAFRPGGALVLSALVFAGLHYQYLVNADLLGYATMASVVFAALIFGLVTLTTGSMLPAIIAHMILNIPMNMEFGAARLALGLGMTAIFAKPMIRYFNLFIKIVIDTDTLVMALCVAAIGGAGYALAAQQIPPGIVVVAAVLAAMSGAIFQNSPWRASSASKST